MRNTRLFVVVGALLALSAGMVGCREHMPHAATLAGGDIQYTHAKPAEGGYYTDWDPYAGSLELMPAEDVNPVYTQHILIATIKDKEGKLLPNRRVEWVIPDGGVGAFVEVDESGWRNSRGYKVTNRYAVTHTNNFAHTLTRGNADPADDIHLTPGQTWAVITSAVEGTTNVVAYAPGIYDWSKHKAFAKKHWYDVAWQFPPAATNPIGTKHKMTTKVMQYSDQAPLAGYEVTYRVTGGPAAMFQESNGAEAMVKTDSSGLATVTLVQAKPTEGTNQIEIDIVRPEDKQCCKPAVHIATGKTSKTWVGPKIAIQKSAPARKVVGDQFRYAITVSNPGRVAATNVMVSDDIPDGLKYVSSSPEAKASGQMLTWSLGSLDGGASKSLSVTVQAMRTGTFRNCADVKADYGLAAQACATTVVGQPKLEVEKTAPAEVLLCEPIKYKFTVRNTGDAPAMNVKLSDELPAGLKWKNQHDTVTADFGTLAPGQSKFVEYDVMASKTGTYTNQAQVTADGGLKAQASVKTVVRQPVLVITKNAPRERLVGTPLTYDITVANKGDGEARNTVLVDNLPANAQFVSASDGGQHSAGRVVWNLGTLAPNASKKVSVRLQATQKGEVRNRVSATAFCAKADGEAVTMVMGIPAILLECVDEADPIQVGANETYTITVTNQGSADDTNIVIKCIVAGDMEYVSADGPTKATKDGKNVTFAPLKSLEPKARATYTVVTKAVKTGDTRFGVELTSDQLTSPVTETESTHIYGD